MSGALKKTGVQIENVTGVGFTAGGALEQKAQGTVGDGVLAQIVIDDEDVAALFHEVFAESAARVGGDVLHGGKVARAGADDGGVFQRAGGTEHLSQLCDGACLLADGDIDAHHVLALLVKNGVDSDGGLAGLAVADDKLTLAAAYREHGVNGKDTRFHRLIDRLTVDYAGGGVLNGTISVGGDGAFAVYRRAERVDHTAEVRVTCADTGGLAGAAHGVTRADGFIVTEEDAADTVFLKILHHAADAALEEQYLAVGGVLKAADVCDTVSHAQDSADLVGQDFRNPAFNSVAYQRNNILPACGYRGELFLELIETAAGRPVDDLGAKLDAEAAEDALILAPAQINALLVLLFKKCGQPTALLLARRAGTAQDGLQFHIGCAHYLLSPSTVLRKSS